MKYLATAALFLTVFGGTAAAQSDAVYVHHDSVNSALSNGGELISGLQIRVAGGHYDKPAALETQTVGTTILFVTDGGGVFVAGARSYQLTKGDLIVVPANMTQRLVSVSPSISYYVVVVPLRRVVDAKADVVYADRDKVAATLKKAGPLADGPGLRVSGGYRTGPYAPADYRPDVEVHVNEADLFYVIDGSATQVVGGTMVGGKETAPGQIRGSKITGGHTYQLTKGDVMWVPAGVAHWFPDIPEPLSYLLVKVFY